MTTSISNRIVLLAAAVFVLTAISAAADAPATPRCLTADFVMTRTLVVLEDEITSRGKLALGGPGVLRWEMTSPSRSVIVVNNGTAWLHYPDMNVTKGFDISSDPVMKVLSEHLLALTAGDFGKMGQLYEISEGEGGARTLIPKQDAVKKVFAQLRVKMGDRGIIDWVEMVSRGGDITRIEFKNVVIDPKLDPSLFEKPAG